MQYLLGTALAILALANPAWADNPAQPVPAVASAAPAPGVKLNAHTQEDMQRHLGMARAHEQAAQCLGQGRPYDECQKQLQTACKGLALGKNCGMRHSH